MSNLKKLIYFLINLHTGPREDDVNPEFNVNSWTDVNGTVFNVSLSHKNPKSPVLGAELHQRLLG